MSPIVKKVWALWDDLDEMASDLGESVNVLRRAHDSWQLPDPRHDRAIAVRARALGKRTITLKALAEIRASRPEVTLEERKATIKAFIDAAGGYQAVSERTGVSKTHLYANAARGFLNRTTRYEYKRLAEEIGFELPPEIFNRPAG